MGHPPAWVEQLAEGGRLVVPLRTKGLNRSWILEHSEMVNAVEFRRATHPLARFLCEITTARAASCVPFAWGAASSLPFLLRIRHGRTVLRSASWNLSASDLPTRHAAWQDWTQAWDGLRRRHRIPDVVHQSRTCA